ncbi:sensor histidine kinase [Accumulibacter sp.]|uniref:ATP-binding protein n=1 Tax=Accumulibacter sp. TaxID=2053492 RepID=UPI00260FF905|nr:sensor histidine kinase [Accumulibacter sp.]
MRRGAWRGSLRIRLLAGTMFWIVASVVVAGWGLGGLFRQHLAEQFQAELKTHLDQLTAHLTIDEQGWPALSVPLSDPRLERPYSGLYWQIDDLASGGAAGTPGPRRSRSRSLWDHVLAAPVDAPADGEVHRHRLDGPAGTRLEVIERRVKVDERPETAAREFRLIVAADERLMIDPATRFDSALWLALGLLAGGLVIAALVQVRVGLAPLRELRAALGHLRSGRTPRLEGDFPAEIAPLVDDFNSVLAHNAEVVERARTQAGNLAHALKTPLAILGNAAAGRDDELARLVATQVDAARRQVHYHLARAQAAAAGRLAGARTALGPVLEGLLRAMRRIHAGRDLELVLHPISPDLVFRGEEQDLQEMLGNLLDNACKWTAGRVEIEARLESGGLTIAIDDDGQGIAAGQRDAVLRRGVRADQQVPGSGLGLSIVGDLAQVYGGGLRLADSPLGGLRALLSLPAADGTTRDLPGT